MRDTFAERSGTQTRGRSLGGRPSVDEVLASLRGRFGDWHEESYEHGKREFAEALAEAFDLDDDGATRAVDELEQAHVLRYHAGPQKDEADGPRVGLFDEPRTVPRGEPVAEPPARGWEIGRDREAGVTA
jgi:hypothetical protein